MRRLFRILSGKFVGENITLLSYSWYKIVTWCNITFYATITHLELLPDDERSNVAIPNRSLFSFWINLNCVLSSPLLESMQYISPRNAELTIGNGGEIYQCSLITLYNVCHCGHKLMHPLLSLLVRKSIYINKCSFILGVQKILLYMGQLES